MSLRKVTMQQHQTGVLIFLFEISFFFKHNSSNSNQSLKTNSHPLVLILPNVVIFRHMGEFVETKIKERIKECRVTFSVIWANTWILSNRIGWRKKKKSKKITKYFHDSAVWHICSKQIRNLVDRSASLSLTIRAVGLCWTKACSKRGVSRASEVLVLMALVTRSAEGEGGEGQKLLYA